MAHVRFYTAAVRGVKPDDISAALCFVWGCDLTFAFVF